MRINTLNIILILNFTVFGILFLLNLIFNSNLDSLLLMRLQSISLLILFSITILALYKRRQGFLLSYLIYLFLTHFGIFIVYIFTDNPFIQGNYNADWFLFDLPSLYFISTIGILAFMITSLLLKNDQGIYRLKSSKNLLFLGYVFISLFTFGFIYLILSGQISLTLSYGEFHSSLSQIPNYEYLILIFSLGIVFVFTNVDIKNIKAPLFMLVIPVLLLLITGNRGEIFYPLLAALGSLINRGFKINYKYIIVILIVFFIVFPFVSETRNADDISLDEINIGLSSSLVEVGYTVRPLSYTILWDNLGEEKGRGISYFVAVQRQVANFLPIDKMDYENKAYSFRDRLPTMGFSVIAEAFYNFGRIGVIFVMILIALILNSLTSHKSVYVMSFGAGVLAILINNIRNAFSFVPGQIIFLLIIVMTVYLISSFNKRKEGSNFDRYN